MLQLLDLFKTLKEQSLVFKELPEPAWMNCPHTNYICSVADPNKHISDAKPSPTGEPHMSHNRDTHLHKWNTASPSYHLSNNESLQTF